MCLNFSKRFFAWGFRQERGRGVRFIAKVYAAANIRRTFFRFHINCLEEFKSALADACITGDLAVWVDPPKHRAVDVVFKVKPQWKARPDQEPYIDYLSAPFPVCKLVGLQTGMGKSLRASTPIKTPNGWKKKSEIQVGDKVTAYDGSETVVTGVYPQGKLQLYRVTFADGRTCDCSIDHLWQIYYVNTVKNKRWRVVDTKEMMRLIAMPNPRVYIPLATPGESPDIDLPVDPYTLGVILGDGGVTGSSVTVSKADPEIFEEIRKTLPDDLRIVDVDDVTKAIRKVGGNTNSLITKLRELGVMGLRSYEKKIPAIYLESSPAQRLAILQGLLDTDGTVVKDGSVSFCSTSIDLAKGVQHLVRSLGGIASLRTRYTHYTYNGEVRDGRPAYQINIRFKTPSSLFRLPRKRNRTNDNNQYAKSLKLRVMSIEPVDVDEAICISIDHPSKLYVAEDYVVTHNTFCALQAVANIGKRVGIFVKANYVKKWVEDVKKTFDIPEERILVIQGGKSLMALLALAKEGKLEADVIIFSLTTLGLWLDAYETEGDGLLDQGYDCLPEDWLNFLGIGVKLVDEAHQHFHAVFKLDLYSHVEYSIALSATMVNKDPFLLKMYDLKFPGKDRPMNMALKRYAHAYAVHYSFIAPDKIRTTEHGSNTYSHTAVEKSIMRHIPTLKNYVDMIDYVMRIGHFENPKKVKKLAVFAATVDMCTHLTEYFSRKYPHLDVRRYVSGDDYSNAIDADIRFTTVGSMGTAIDIPNLTTVILTNAIASLQANVQVLGRLREITGEKVEFYYFTADNIPKHVEYYEEKKILMKERAASFHEVFVGFKI